MQHTVYSRSVWIQAPVEKAFAFCSSRSGFEQHFPYAVDWRGGPSEWSQDDELNFRYRLFGIWLPHKAQITKWQRNECFVDEMTAGLYRRFVHTHQFQEKDGGTLYTDRICFNLGFGRWLDRTLGIRVLDQTFRRRHERLKAILEAGDSRPPHAQETPS